MSSGTGSGSGSSAGVSAAGADGARSTSGSASKASYFWAPNCSEPNDSAANCAGSADW